MLNQRQILTGPKNTITIITEILQKHLPEENDKEFFDRFKKQGKTRAKIIKELIEKQVGRETDKTDIALDIKKELGVSMKKATDIVDDIKATIFSAKQETEGPETPLKQKVGITKQKSPDLKTKDLYREKIEIE